MHTVHVSHSSHVSSAQLLKADRHGIGGRTVGALLHAAKVSVALDRPSIFPLLIIISHNIALSIAI